MTDFEITIDQLCDLHKEKGLETLEELGGTTNLIKKVKTSLDAGVLTSEVATRQKVFGENRIEEARVVWYIELIWDALGDFTIRLLCACAVFSIIMAVSFERDVPLSWLEGTTILITVLVVINIQAMQDWLKARSFRSLTQNAATWQFLFSATVSAQMLYATTLLWETLSTWASAIFWRQMECLCREPMSSATSRQ